MPSTTTFGENGLACQKMWMSKDVDVKRCGCQKMWMSKDMELKSTKESEARTVRVGLGTAWRHCRIAPADSITNAADGMTTVLLEALDEDASETEISRNSSSVTKKVSQSNGR